jgi:hypothetical protein
MSNRYKGAVISATPPTTTGGNDGVASGAWTLEQQMQAQAAGLWPNQPVFYIEDVFSTYLYTGTGAAQTITNGINLSGKGGLVWIKERTSTSGNIWTDTVRGVYNYLQSDNNNAQTDNVNTLTAFNTNGFAVGNSGATSESGQTYASWTFREQPKFFDIVTYTGNGTASRNIAHNLGSVPGCYIVKETNYSGTNWLVYHQSLGNTKEVYLNETNASTTTNSWASTTPTSAVFTVNFSGGTGPNGNGSQYVAYLFAHNAGGFGLTGTDNVITCGSFTTDGSGNATIDLGYEPQYLLWKASSQDGNWLVLDNMRGWTNGGNDSLLRPNTSDAESTGGQYGNPTATGFYMQNMAASTTYIYIAIRRGPMRVPTVGTSVFIPIAYNGNSVLNRLLTTGFTTDVIWRTERFKTSGVSLAYNGNMSDRLSNGLLKTNLTSADDPTLAPVVWGSNVGVIYPTDNYINNATGSSYILYGWQRAPGFFDEVCYTGTGSATTQTHNLGAVPEMMIVKWRTGATGSNWSCYHSALGNTQVISLNEDIQAYTASQWNNTTPTSTVFSVGTQDNVNGSAKTYVAYLFATCAGVSKVGSYTGTGALQTVNCGFTAGARFVLIKRTDSTGDWWSYDSARGITSGNDPYLYWNTAGAEVSGTNYVDTTAVGFQVTAAAPAGLNANGGTFIFLAIA